MTLLALDSRQFSINHHIDCGIALMQANRHAQAVLEFNTVLKLEPLNRYARWNRALAFLCMGDYQQGMPEHDWAWEIYEWRALGPVKGNVDRILELPEWKGEKCKLIVYHEMGFGDAICFMRFLPDLVKRCESLTLVIRPELVSLFSGYGANVVGAVPEDCSGFDARATLFNSIWLAGWCHSVTNKPYLPAEFSFTGNKMGIAWSGNSQTNFKAKTFLAHLDHEGYELYALQPGPSPGLGIIPLPEGADFEYTRQLMQTLDVIVVCDTATAHLAGAIGHPSAHVVTPFLRDWRWWNTRQWYSKLNVYSQPNPGDWGAAFVPINLALRNGH